MQCVALGTSRNYRFRSLTGTTSFSAVCVAEKLATFTSTSPAFFAAAKTSKS
jgi:hypothetical protein